MKSIELTLNARLLKRIGAVVALATILAAAWIGVGRFRDWLAMRAAVSLSEKGFRVLAFRGLRDRVDSVTASKKGCTLFMAFAIIEKDRNDLELGLESCAMNKVEVPQMFAGKAILSLLEHDLDGAVKVLGVGMQRYPDFDPLLLLAIKIRLEKGDVDSKKEIKALLADGLVKFGDNALFVKRGLEIMKKFNAPELREQYFERLSPEDRLAFISPGASLPKTAAEAELLRAKEESADSADAGDEHYVITRKAQVVDEISGRVLGDTMVSSTSTLSLEDYRKVYGDEPLTIYHKNFKEKRSQKK